MAMKIKTYGQMWFITWLYLVVAYCSFMLGKFTYRCDAAKHGGIYEQGLKDGAELVNKLHDGDDDPVKP